MKIYTKTGDAGTTSLVSGTRVEKGCARLNAYGTIDELNAVMGVALEEIRSASLQQSRKQAKQTQTIVEQLLWIQNCLFSVGGILATEAEKIETYWSDNHFAEWTKQLEEAIDAYNNDLPVNQRFILPSGSKSCAMLHWARTVCRRAEREICLIKDEMSENNTYFFHILQFINRLSDYLFIASRKVLQIENIEETYWESGK